MLIDPTCKKSTAHFILVADRLMQERGGLVVNRERLPNAAWWLIFFGAILRLATFFASRTALVTYRLPDDALYYFTIAKHILLGHGVSFDGVHPTNGFHPLWMLAILPINFLGLTGWGYIQAVLVLQSAIDILNLWLVAKLVQRLTLGFEPRARLQAILLSIGVYALSATAIIRGINGLETTITACMILLWTGAFCELYRHGLSTSKSGLLKLAAYSALLFLARTDYAVVELIALGILMLLHRRELRLMVPSLVTALGFGLLIVAPWLIWNYITFGSIVQVSGNAVPFLAQRKLDVLYGSHKWIVLLREGARTMLKPFVYCALGLPLILFTALLVRRSRVRLLERLSSTGLLPILLGSLILLAYHSIVRGMIRDWYILQLVPFIAVLFGVTIAIFFEDWPKRERFNPRIVERAIWALVTVSLLISAFVELRTPRYASQKVVVEQGVPFVESASGIRIGALNSGYYGFFAPPKVLLQNLDGVVNPRILDYLYRGDLHDYLDQDSIDYILEFPPDLAGYRGLIDHRFTEKFEHALWLAGGEGSDSLELLRRIGVLHP